MCMCVCVSERTWEIEAKGFSCSWQAPPALVTALPDGIGLTVIYCVYALQIGVNVCACAFGLNANTHVQREICPTYSNTQHTTHHTRIHILCICVLTLFSITICGGVCVRMAVHNDRKT